MNKITQKPELQVQYISLNKQETDSFRHKMIMKTSQLLTRQVTVSSIHAQSVPETDYESKSIFIKKQALQRTLSVYQWRHKTCYPVIKATKLIVKSFTGNMRQKRSLCKKDSQSPFEIWNLDQNLYELIVITENVHHRLSQISSLSLPQLFYLLKQALFGFECLIDIFGIFQPTEDMIAISDQNQWRFWITEDFSSNSKKQSNTTQADFILKIIKMVQSRITSSKVGAKFFQQLKNLPVRSFTFLNILDMTNIFISFNKIIVAKKYVSPQNNSNKSLYGAKNQSYFKLNRTYNELKDTQKNANDKTYDKNFNKRYLDQFSPKKLSGIHKISTMMNLNDKSSYTRKQSFKINSSNRQNELKKQKQIKAPLKISQFYYPQTLTKNNIEKRASFLFHSGQLPLQKSKEDFLKNKISIGEFSKTQSPTSFKPSNSHVRTSPFIQGGKKLYPTSPISRKLSFEHLIKTETNLAKLQLPVQIVPTNNNIPNSPKQRKNSYYNYQKPINKQAFSQSPNKSSAKHIYSDQNHKKVQKQINPSQIHTRRQNILMNQQSCILQRTYSENAPKIRILDESAKKSRKMFESSTIQAVQIHKDVKYGNLKSKDIARHNCHATISGMAFGQSAKRVQKNGFNNINNDIYNGKFYQIMKSIKSKSNGDNNDDRQQPSSGVTVSRKRRVSFFDEDKQATQRKVSQQFQLQSRPNYDYSPHSNNQNKCPKPIIRVSNVNNQTAQSMKKSQLNNAKGSQSNSVSNNQNKSSNIRQSDTNSNEKQHVRNQDRRGMIGHSYLSVFSCKTYQPGKEGDKKWVTIEREKGMVNSQNFFNNHNNESESSEQFLKSNNWNKKISGLFNEEASIKMLKESSHFGDEYQLFEKDHLKDVKLDKLDKFGKQLKGSIIQMQDGRHVMNIPTRGMHNKQFLLIDEVKEQPYQNDPSYLQYSTSILSQSKNMEYNRMETQYVEKNVKHCESFQQEENGYEKGYENGYENGCEEINGGFNFATELYKLTSNNQ